MQIVNGAKLRTEVTRMEKAENIFNAKEAGYKSAIEQMLAEIKSNHKQMQRDKKEIEKMKTRTRAKLEELESAIK